MWRLFILEQNVIDIINESDFQVTSSRLHVVKFWSVWCKPCIRLEPAIKQLESEFNMINFLSVDVDQVPTLAQKFRIKTLPTLIFIKDGAEVNRVVGLSLIEPLRKILRDLTPTLTKDMQPVI